MCRSFFYAVLTYCALPITVTARSWSKNEHFSLYREKAREEKEGKHRLWERCVNRLRFSAVSIAAAREKREGGVFAQAACRRSFALPFLPEYQGLFCIIVRRNRAKVLLYMERHKGRLMLPDQDIISALYGQSIIPLDPIQYNMTEKLFTLHRFNGDGMTLDDVRQRSAVIHYCGRNKPWKPGYVGELDVFYNETVSQMEKDLP